MTRRMSEEQKARDAEKRLEDLDRREEAVAQRREEERRLGVPIVDVTPEDIYGQLDDAALAWGPHPPPFGIVVRNFARTYGLSVKKLKRYCPALRRVYDTAVKEAEEERRGQEIFAKRLASQRAAARR